jgi:hypothetical protein
VASATESDARGIIDFQERPGPRGSVTPEQHIEILDRLLDGVAIVRQSDHALVYANPALAAVLAVETDELEHAVDELVRSGRANAIELAHPDFGLIRMIFVPRDQARAAERAWRRDLRREMARARRRGWPLTVGAIGLDAGGSTQAAAAAWLKALRAEDSITPYDDGAYLMVLPDCPAEAALGIAERLRQATPPPATTSIGFTIAIVDEPIDSVIRRALRALAEARAAGTNQVVVAPSQAAAGQS